MREKLPLDYTAPRYRPDSTQIATEQFFKTFFKENPEFAVFREQFDNKELKNIIKTFNQNLVQVAIDHRDGILLPEGLGWIYLATISKAKRKVNHKLSNELGHDINFTNNHSDGKLLRISYTNKHHTYKFENKNLWGFKASDDFKDSASKQFHKNYARYFPLENRRAIQKRQDDFYGKENTRAPKIKKYKAK